MENKATSPQKKLPAIKEANSQLENENTDLEEICNWRYYEKVFEHIYCRYEWES
jgi:hypothetical protein